MEKELWKYLKTAQKPIVLYGMGNGADKIINALNRYNIPFKGVFASEGFKKQKLFHGHKIASYSELKEKFGDMIVLLCFGSERPEVLRAVKKLSLETELYAPEVPVIGEGLFTEEYFEKNKEAFDWVYERLADGISRKTFKNIIKYKLSGKLNYLSDCEVTKQEPYESFLNLSDNESFLDLGAYNGDTVLEFLSRVNSYNRITAVEPDIKSFKKLIKNTDGIKDISRLNICISDFDGIGRFSMKFGRGSATLNGDSEIAFARVDSLKASPTYIKMDVEGEEIKAIRGAIGTIKQLKPKMLISCYHRTEDLISIPQEVFKIREDYKLYIRHFPAFPAWDTNFYFI